MSAFLVYILKVALLTAVFVLLYHLLLRRDTFHRTARIVLVSSLVISYVLPFCVITIHRPAPVVENPEFAAIQAPAAVPATGREADPAGAESDSGISRNTGSATTGNTASGCAA